MTRLKQYSLRTEGAYLVAGVKYTLQLAAIGGSNGQSDWSDPIEKIAT